MASPDAAAACCLLEMGLSLQEVLSNPWTCCSPRKTDGEETQLLALEQTCFPVPGQVISWGHLLHCLCYWGPFNNVQPPGSPAGPLLKLTVSATAIRGGTKTLWL
ncbi:hypothetical protein KIL84_013192 [Mauremys mutica]|uniref:Uncharacterized protein n=1 Tax=Mauremys mutica TaxID=74926 RepID=A0A9D3WWZ3_9SAUR|nr:hypothetical protein KIL84_013192 [Mauremys mutica]